MYSKSVAAQKQKHLELVNTIKRENVELKEQINQIYLMLQQSVLSNHLNKQNTFLENDEIEVDEKINLDKLKELEKKIKLESNQQKNIEKKIKEIKNEKEQFFDRMNYLNREVEKYQKLISTKKNEKQILEKELKDLQKIQIVNKKKPQKPKNIPFLSCYFYNERNVKQILIKKIVKKEPIKTQIYFSNNGLGEWPKDSILKCINDDSDIYFLSQKLTKEELLYSKKKNKEYIHTNINIIFKNYNKIKKGYYTLKIQMYSDLKGKIGEGYGEVVLNVV